MTLRLLLAALFVFGSMLGTVALLSSHFGEGAWPWWTKLLPAVVLLASLGVAVFVFNAPGYRRLGLSRKTLTERLAELEAQGQLLKLPFQAVRAFEVEEVEDEGPHYYVELVDGRVLYLNGQYLYDYEPITDDPEMNQPRSFPCTEFEILRHKLAGYVVHIKSSGTVLEPEFIGAPFTRQDFEHGIPEDGQIITDRSYETIKSARSPR